MASSKIEWTQETWNPVSGCTRASRGCDNCYAVTMTRRLDAMGNEKYKGLVNPKKNHFNGKVLVHPSALDIPLNKTKPTVYFVNSMSDLFHPKVDAIFIEQVFEVMAKTPRHTYQILTKRPERMADLVPSILDRIKKIAQLNGSLTKEGVLKNVWLGTSVEEEAVITRVHHLARTPSHIRFLSCEPLIGPLDYLPLKNIHWVIVGGESGPKARPMDLKWVKSIIEQCRLSKTACFVKQLGSKPFITDNRYKQQERHILASSGKGGEIEEWPKAIRVRQFPPSVSV